MDRGLHHGLHHLIVLNPLKSEQEAFRFLLWVVAVFAVIVAIVLVVRAF